MLTKNVSRNNINTCAENIIRSGKALRKKGKSDLALLEFEKANEIITGFNDIFLQNKILNEIEITQKKTVLQSKPSILTVSLTSNCNLKCKMCGYHNKTWINEDFDISENLAAKIEEMFPYLETIVWQGGEVFLSKHFQGLFTKASTFKHLKQYINTNGLLINEKWARILIGADNVVISYSIDGVTKETYENIRKGGKFEDLLKSINLINEYKKSNNKVATEIQFTVMKTNYKELIKLLEFVNEHKFSQLRLNLVNWIDSDENIFYHNNLDAANYLKDIRSGLFEKAAKYNIKFEYLLPEIEYFDCCDKSFKSQPDETRRDKIKKRCRERLGRDILCYLPWKKMFIENMDVNLDCYCRQKLGDLKMNSLEEIWNGRNIQAYRRNMVSNNFDWCIYKCMLGMTPWINGTYPEPYE